MAAGRDGIFWERNLRHQFFPSEEQPSVTKMAKNDKDGDMGSVNHGAPQNGKSSEIPPQTRVGFGEAEDVINPEIPQPKLNGDNPDGGSSAFMADSASKRKGDEVHVNEGGRTGHSTRMGNDVEKNFVSQNSTVGLKSSNNLFTIADVEGEMKGAFVEEVPAKRRASDPTWKHNGRGGPVPQVTSSNGERQEKRKIREFKGVEDLVKKGRIKGGVYGRQVE